jgi:hypothetical protein
MRKGYRKRGSVRTASQRERRARQAGQGREIQLRLDPGELVATLQESVAEFATQIGLKVASLLLEDEVEQRCGRRYERRPDRAATRYGHQRGVAVMAGQ